MSGRWPATLLSATNQQLTDRIEHISLELESKRNSVTELRDVVELLRRNQRQVERQTKAAADALAAKRGDVERDEGRYKQLCHEVESAARHVREAEVEDRRLASTVAAMEEGMEARRRALQEAQLRATELEEEAKEVVLANLARQRVGEELAAAQRELSSTVWAKLERLNLRVRASAQQLTDARTEHRHVLHELDAMQQRLRGAVKEQAESVRALELVHAQTSHQDEQVIANAALMESMLQEAQLRRAALQALRSSLDRYRAENARHCAARNQHRSRHDKLLNALRELMDSLQAADKDVRSLAARQGAEVHYLHQRRRELEHVMRLCEEKASLLALERERHASLQEARTLLDKQAASDGPSPATLREVFLSLSRQQETLEDRLARTQAKLSAALQAFVEEGRKGEHVNEVLAEKQAARQALLESGDVAEGEAQLLRQRCAQLESLLAERRALLPHMQALALEQRAQRQEAWMRDVEQLRATLLAVQREYQQLRQGVTAMRSSLFLSRKSLDSSGSSQVATLDALRLLEGEVAALEREEAMAGEAERDAASQLEQAQVALQSLMKAADAQVGVLKESAGVEAYLRAEVQIKEEQIRADMQASLVELHLHEKELHELGDELQRHNKKLALLRMRYEEVMGSLARASQTALSGEPDKGSFPLLSSAADAVSSDPEAMHAHLLLRRSFEREQLMQRGNYLDLRLVTLDRETATLRHMLDGLRGVSDDVRHATAGLLSDRTNGGGAQTKQHARRSPGNETSPSPTSSTAALREQVRSEVAANEQFWKVEADLLDEASAAMSHERDRARAQLSELRSTLKELQQTEKQKRMQLQKLRHSLERSHFEANAAAIRSAKRVK